MDTQTELNIIEQIHPAHFMFLPNKLGYSVLEKYGLKIINCGLGSSMFNIVYGTLTSPASHWKEEIRDIITIFQSQPFAWWIPHSLKSSALSADLIKAGLITETAEHAMICDLGNISIFKQRTELSIIQVQDYTKLADFISILEPYDETCKFFYERFPLELLDSAEKLFVGYVRNRPMIIGVLFKGKEASGIFSLLTSEDARGRGYGTDMMKYLMQFAKTNGSKYVTLSASSDSGYRIYERLGFELLGEFECFEFRG